MFILGNTFFHMFIQGDEIWKVNGRVLETKADLREVSQSFTQGKSCLFLLSSRDITLCVSCTVSVYLPALPASGFVFTRICMRGMCIILYPCDSIFLTASRRRWKVARCCFSSVILRFFQRHFSFSFRLSFPRILNYIY